MKRDLLELFPGPVPFNEQQGEIFFGRDREAERLRELLQVYRTVLLHAQSGAGKTSLVRAGLTPMLDAAGVPWKRSRVGGISGSSLNLPAGKNVFSAMVLPEKTELSKHVTPDAEHVLILDQFEELFTNFPDRWSDRGPFFRELADLLRARPGLRILFVIREDFVARLEPFSFYLPEQFQIRMFLERLRGGPAQDAVRRPFELAGVQFESDKLLESFIDNLRNERVQKEFSADGVEEYTGEFPDLVQLQVVCRNLARGIGQTGVTTIGQREIDVYGNPEQSLVRFYDEGLTLVAKKSRLKEDRLRTWFEVKLITSAGTRGTGFMGPRDTEGLPNSIVESLEEPAHLLRSEPRAGGRWVEITHDRLIAPIRQSNQEWRRRRKKRLTLIFAACVLIGAVGSAFALARIYRPREPGEVKINPKDGQRYVWIPPGTFMMGCSPGDKDCDDNDEKPAHQVTISRGFWLGQTPVTVGAWRRYAQLTRHDVANPDSRYELLITIPGMPPEAKILDFHPLNPGWANEQQPILDIDWYKAREFCAAAGGRLPTEAEWEYAARAGTTEARYGDLDAIAWYADNSGKERIDSTALWRDDTKNHTKNYDYHLLGNGNGPKPVGTKQPNKWNLYDMLGDVWQWTADWYGEKYYEQRDGKNPLGPPGGEERALRGGSWNNSPGNTRVSGRYSFGPATAVFNVGVRCVGE